MHPHYGPEGGKLHFFESHGTIKLTNSPIVFTEHLLATPGSYQRSLGTPPYDAQDIAGSNNVSEGSSIVQQTPQEHQPVDANFYAYSLEPEDSIGPSPQISDS